MSWATKANEILKKAIKINNLESFSTQTTVVDIKAEDSAGVPTIVLIHISKAQSQRFSCSLIELRTL